MLRWRTGSTPAWCAKTSVWHWGHAGSICPRADGVMARPTCLSCKIVVERHQGAEVQRHARAMIFAACFTSAGMHHAAGAGSQWRVHGAHFRTRRALATCGLCDHWADQVREASKTSDGRLVGEKPLAPATPHSALFLIWRQKARVPLCLGGFIVCRLAFGESVRGTPKSRQAQDLAGSRPCPWPTLSVKIQCMLLPPPHGTERIQSLAARLGCAAGELNDPSGLTKPALLGSLSGSAKILEEFGGTWHQVERVYLFANWPMLEAALQHVAGARERSRSS